MALLVFQVNGSVVHLAWKALSKILGGSPF